jgi:hypothetical protein
MKKRFAIVTAVVATAFCALSGGASAIIFNFPHPPSSGAPAGASCPGGDLTCTMLSSPNAPLLPGAGAARTHGSGFTAGAATAPASNASGANPSATAAGR